MNWSSDALFDKSFVFLSRAFKDVRRDDPLFPLWSALGLELLARAAVAHVHPTLLAEPGEPNNLYHALGYEVRAPKSVGAATVFRRCQYLIEDFTDEHVKACTTLMHFRNEDLHSGGLPFESLRTEQWLPSFFRAVKVLLAFMDKGLPDLFGPEEAAAAEALLVDVSRDVQIDVDLRIGQARAAFEKRTADERAHLAAVADNAAAWMLAGSAEEIYPCPACGCSARRAGESVRLVEPRLVGEIVQQEHIILATSLTCPACELRLSSQVEMAAANLSGQFSSVEEWSAEEFYGQMYEESNYEPDYGND